MAETVELADLGVLGVEMEAAALYYYLEQIPRTDLSDLHSQ